MTAPPHVVLESARSHAEMSFRDLWIAYFALGGRAQPDALRAYLSGQAALSMEYDVLAQALNECFLDQGGDHPVPYHDELF